MTVKIADDYEALNKRLCELEMERSRRLAEKVNEPEDKNAWYLGLLAPDYDGA